MDAPDPPPSPPAPAEPAGFAERVRREADRLVPRPRPLVLAVSGGADSMALLHALARDAGRPAPLVAHLDHALRTDSAEDAAFVADAARALGLACVVERVDVAAAARKRGGNVEQLARRVRYAFLHRAAKRAGSGGRPAAIATAHTRDDQAETALMQLLRGAAFPAGMPEARGLVLRPLLREGRAEARAWLRTLGAPWREDPSNADLARERAWLRHRVLPLLAERHPAVAAGLAAWALEQRDAREHLEAEARRLDLGGRSEALELRALARADAALQRQALAGLMRRAGAPVRRERIEEARARLADAAEAPVRLSLSPGRTLRLAYGRAEVVGPAAPPPEERSVTRPEGLPGGAPAALLAGGPLLLRGRRPGDRVRLPGGSKKLSDLLVDRKVPREERDALRLLARGNEVLWIEGVPLEDPDARWMRRALELADEAAAAGEMPVGALVVADGAVLGEARNETEARRDPTAHAEALALRRAAAARGDWRLPDATLYVTLEPCPMCFGALLQAHVGRVVYGADNRREGALGTVADLRRAPWKREVEVRGGVLAVGAGERLTRFFEGRRAGVGEPDGT